MPPHLRNDRAFKREFGITLGELRKSGLVVKVKPPIYLFDEKYCQMEWITPVIEK